MTSTVSTRDPIEDLVSRWSSDKLTKLAFEHSWTIGKFPVLDQFSSKKSEEEMLSPEFEVEGHDIKFQIKLKYAGMQAEDDKMNVHFSLCCAPKNEFISGIGIKFLLTIFNGTTVSGTYGKSRVVLKFNKKNLKMYILFDLGPISCGFTESNLPYRTTLKNLPFTNRNSLYLINEMKVLLKV